KDQLKPEGNYKYKVSLAKMTESLRFTIVAGDAKIDEKRIRLMPPPVLAKLSAITEEPAYLIVRVDENRTDQLAQLQLKDRLAEIGLKFDLPFDPQLGLKKKRFAVQSDLSLKGNNSEIKVAIGTDVHFLAEIDRDLGDYVPPEPARETTVVFV